MYRYSVPITPRGLTSIDARVEFRPLGVDVVDPVPRGVGVQDRLLEVGLQELRPLVDPALPDHRLTRASALLPRVPGRHGADGVPDQGCVSVDALRTGAQGCVDDFLLLGLGLGLCELRLHLLVELADLLLERDNLGLLVAVDHDGGSATNRPVTRMFR